MIKSTTFSGSAIAITLIAIAAMTTVTLGVAELVPRDFRQSQALENALAAENAAWSGVERSLLDLRHNPFYEQSQELAGGSANRPYGGYDGCVLAPTTCPPGFDRKLGVPINQTPISYKGTASDLGLADDVGYSTTVWHMMKQVGTSDLNDGLLDHSRNAPNSNPIIERDGTRVLDVTKLDDATTGSSSVTLHWAPIFHTATEAGFAGQCTQTSGSRFILSYTWLDDNNAMIGNNRGLLDYAVAAEQSQILSNPNPSVAHRLQLRFLATTASSTDDTIKDCFMRYSLATSTAAANMDGVDLGMSVIESTGVSGSVRRKVRVTVDRQNGAIINIFDFGVACQQCNLPQ